MALAETCGSCRHWDKAPRPPTVAGAEHRDSVVPGEWGTCGRIIRYGDSSHEVPPTLDEPTDDPAYLSDGSGYFASLTTRSDFGCALWEAHTDGTIGGEPDTPAQHAKDWADDWGFKPDESDEPEVDLSSAFTDEMGKTL